MNITTHDSTTEIAIEDYYVVAALSVGFSFLATIICTGILILIWRTKPRLHTVHHLLICNTCIATIFYCVSTTNNYVYLLFIKWETSDISCRVRAYFAYVGIAGVVYSYLTQSISRFFFSVLSIKYRWLITFKMHYILISIQWLIVFSITSSSLITNDVTFHPVRLCFIQMENTLHVVCVIFAYYILPLLAIIIIYVYIYFRVKYMKRNTMAIVTSVNRQKRDLELLRNIIILLSIYLGGGLPSIVYFLTRTKYPYLINLVTQSLTVAIAKICIVLLDREIRQTIKNMIYPKTSVMPFKNTYITGRIQNTLQSTKKTNVQSQIQL